MTLQDQEQRDREHAWDALAPLKDHPAIEAWLTESDGRRRGGVPQLRVAPIAKHSERPSPRVFRVAAAILLLAIGTAAGLSAYHRFSVLHYETGIGEQRDVLLPDGSRVTLNTNTALTVKYSAERRYMDLERGEALFAVKRNPTRPFEVTAGGTLTRALGTEFNVDLRKSGVTVSVLEGVVRVAPTADDSTMPRAAGAGGSAVAIPPAALAKGQALQFQPQARRLLEEKADLKRIDAWRTRRLEFSNTPLSEAVEEVNRYSTRVVVIGTHQLADVRVSGVFRTGDVEGFLYSLREALGVQTHDSADEVVVIRPDAY
jgi:transmembrane sensor